MPVMGSACRDAHAQPGTPRTVTKLVVDKPGAFARSERYRGAGRGL